MRTHSSKQLWLAALLGACISGCGSFGGVSISGGIGGGPAGSGGSETPTGSGGVQGDGGSSDKGSGGTVAESGGNGAGGTVAGSGGKGPGGTGVGTGGKGAGGATVGTGGAPGGTGGAKVDAGGQVPGEDCIVGTWPTADPAAAGPFAVVAENEVGPEAGAAVDGGAVPRFTLFRPKDMAQSGLCHPVITWGNGTGANPKMYKVLLNNLASHGFVVIASNSPNVAQGSPAPMVVGVTWVLEQNEDSTSVLYHHIDTTHIGATGHSQGAMAASQASGDSHIVASAPIEGAMAQKNLHGPALFFCGGQDTLVGCSGAQNALKAVTTTPAMYANYLSVDHGSWMSFTGSKASVVEATVTAWMRVHLMGDSELRSWFYGPSCKLCADSGWEIDRKNMDE